MSRHNPLRRPVLYAGAAWAAVLALGFAVSAIAGLRRLGPVRVIVFGVLVGLLGALARALWTAARRPD